MPACRRGLRLLLRGVLVVATALYFAFVATILILRYSILPNIGLYHDRIESLAGDALGLPVKVGEIQASWDGLDPALTLLDVQLVDAQGRPALNLRRVESVFSWLSALRLQPTFALLAVDGPTLHLRRDKSGHIFVAGFGAEGESDPRLAEWVLRQPHIRIRDAAIVWHDELRGAPPLVLNELQFGLDNRGKLHRFGLTAVPPERLAARLDLRGEWRGSSLEDLENWAGQLYAELDYADLAGWRDWIDYPVNLPRGRGALRLWLERDGSGASARNSLTADVALEDVRLRLGAELPELDLGSLRGRIAARQVGNQRDVLASRLELSTRDGLRVPPSDFTVHWQQNDDGRHSGTLTADYLDLDVLSRLAAHLPLDATVRQLLARHQPRGRLTELHGNWEGQQATAAEAAAGGENRLNRYSLRSRFADLGSAPVGGIPGAGGLAGRVSVDEKGGSLQLDSSDAWLELPAIFPESRVALNKLQAGASWKHQAGQLEVKLERLDFANDDAAGSARGTYRHTGEGPGEIDLSAHLNRANASAVWRYMPRVVNPNARSWLQRGLVSGTAPEAHLTLKGDLRHFPFRDKRQGQFLVTVKARDVRLDYAPGWPVIEGIDGELRFEGPGMKIDAQRGAILGARLHNTKVEIPDFDVHDEMLQVDGQAAGPTSEFLRFIAQSPISAKIDHFTEEMQATGNGRLRLNLQLPLSRIDDSKIRGEYFFDNNQVVFLPGLPPFSQVNGRLDFSEAAVNAKDVAGNFLGSPARLSARSQGDLVGIVATGGASIRELRKLHDLPVFNALSGSSPWRAEIRVRKKNVDLQIESSLQGIASSLPEPLNKSATQALPLRLERMAMDWQPVRGEPRPVTRERWRVQLGKVLDGTLVRRQQGEAMQFERAVLAVGEPAQLPDKGLNVVINVPRLPLESWRDNLLGPERGQGAAGAAGFDPSGLPPPLFILRTPLLEAYGRSFANVDLRATPRDNGWQLGLNMKDIAGDVFWDTGGKGFVRADLKRLLLPAANQKGGSLDLNDDDSLLNSLPGLDIHVGDFAIGERHFGRLDVKAHNDGGLWLMDKVNIDNPDGNLQGKGQWKSGSAARTQLEFELEARDVGKLLDRLGFPGTIKRGTAHLKGDLAWPGAPTGLEYAGLSGRLDLDASRGQFAKVDPGVGKLLGLLSLQSLPRRITLDFRDIFSEGFAFDAIDARLDIRNGVIRTREDLHIDGPAGRILMQGEADLRQESQSLLVSVQPEVAGVAALGAVVMAHPVAGVATIIANKVFQNPLNKVFGFQYRVSGSWADPQVEKVGTSVGAAGAGPAPAGKENK